MSWVDERLDPQSIIEVQGSSGSLSSSWIADPTSSSTPSNISFFVPWPEFVNEEFQLLNNPPIWQVYFQAPVFSGRAGVLEYYGVSAAESANLTWVQLYGRVAATFFGTANLADFPYDTQDIPFSIESTMYSNLQVLYRGAPGNDAILSANLYVPGFQVLYGYSTTSQTWYPAWQQYYCRWSAVAYVSRNASYYLKKSILNVIMLVVMSLTAALLRPDDPTRAAVQITLFLGIVSWVFVLSNDSPRSQVSTRMDGFINTSFAVMFVMFLYHSATMMIHHVVLRRNAKGAAAAKELDVVQPPSPLLLGRAGTSPKATEEAKPVPWSDVFAPFNVALDSPGSRGRGGAERPMAQQRSRSSSRLRPRIDLSAFAAPPLESPSPLWVHASSARPRARAGSGTGSPRRRTQTQTRAPSGSAAADELEGSAGAQTARKVEFMGIKSNIRIRDLAVTCVVLAVYIIVVAVLLWPPTPRPAPPPLI